VLAVEDVGVVEVWVGKSSMGGMSEHGEGLLEGLEVLVFTFARTGRKGGEGEAGNSRVKGLG